jgi:hypothetical protein
MSRSMWKTVVLATIPFLALSVVLFSTVGFSRKALASGPTYVPCENTTWVIEVPKNASATGVQLQGQILGLMDQRNNATYCGEMVTHAIVTTTHTGVLEANLYGLITITCQVPSGGEPCPKSGNTYTNYGSPYPVNAGVNQCANDVFKDRNGNNVAAFLCWTAS